jgi:Dolichyl-phosphate-mannose-protein mannosyltransferase
MKRRSWTAGFVLLGCLVAGAVLNRAAIRGPLVLDDLAQRAMIDATLTRGRGPFNLYDFVSGDNRPDLLARGAIPWWSNPHLVIRFLRPLPSALVWVDHRLFGYGAVAPHLVSLLWWAGAVLAAYALYRTAAGPRAGLVAVVLFAISPTLAIPLVWLANRDTLLTLTFGALALTSYVRWRRDRSWRLGFVAAAAFGASALTGEYALCLAGYIVAFELCHPGESYGRRLTGTLPAAVPLILYALTHVALGYGTTGCGFYRDPITDPGGYLRALPRVLSVLLASAWLGVDETSSWVTWHPFPAVLIFGGAVLVLGTIWNTRRGALSGDGGAWLASGSVLALIPLTTTEPSRRILGIAALGVSGALGVLIERWARGFRRPLRPWGLAGVIAVALIGYVHLIAAPLETRRLSRQAVEDEIRSVAELSMVRRQNGPVDTTLVLRANYSTTVLWTPFALRSDAPNHWWVLSQTFEQTVGVRTSPSSIEVSEEEGPLFPAGPTDFFRTTPFHVGDMVEVPGLHATVLRVDEAGRPLAVHYEFNRALGSSDVAWISEGRSGFGYVVPPPVGIGVRLAR